MTHIRVKHNASVLGPIIEKHAKLSNAHPSKNTPVNLQSLTIISFSVRFCMKRNRSMEQTINPMAEGAMRKAKFSSPGMMASSSWLSTGLKIMIRHRMPSSGAKAVVCEA
mmetsp:Transcript_8618/g.17125  ORF Transcript_8618/g.17125 Transcript_8618/m.17125 type:complete len:110 (-) Transcript_8618:1029-1358(-)